MRSKQLAQPCCELPQTTDHKEACGEDTIWPTGYPCSFIQGRKTTNAHDRTSPLYTGSPRSATILYQDTRIASRRRDGGFVYHPGRSNVSPFSKDRAGRVMLSLCLQHSEQQAGTRESVVAGAYTSRSPAELR